MKNFFLENILKEHSTGKENFESDYQYLLSITSEVKAINNQAAILHGERIKKAQNILTRYRDGAFTSWLIAAYGNRQTPYNFLQYYEFYEQLPKILRPQIESMPRQAIYTLASRNAPFEKKKEFVENYQGETKLILLGKIREQFPLDSNDKRSQNIGDTAIKQLQKVALILEKKRVKISKTQKNMLNELLGNLSTIISEL